MVSGAHFLAVAAMSAVGAAPGAVDEGLLASYDLFRADCVNGTFPDGAGAGGPLVRTASTRCLHGLGVAADGAAPRVTAGAAALRDALGASAEDGSDGLTVELWLRLDGVGESTEEQPIISIGAPDATSDFAYDNIGLRLSQDGENLLVDMIFRGESPYDDEVVSDYFTENIPDLIGDVAGGNVSHLVVTVGQKIDIYVNDLLYYSKNFMFDYEYDTFLASEAWADTFTMELFSDGISRYEGAEPFVGDIFTLRIYDHKLDAAEAAQNYAAGLPQTPALAYAVEATINEDGEAIAGSLLDIAPKLYAGPLPASRLGTVSLKVVDLDEATGYDRQATKSTAMIATLPENGEILHVDGTPIKVGDVLDPPRLLARPPLDAVGQNVMNFSYRAVDGGTGSISGAATVLISTTPVNDPPMPSNMTLVAEAGAARLITLLGTDVDDPVATAVAVLDGPISPDVAIVLNATARTVSYLYEGPVTTETMDPETGVFLVESFRFRLIDAHDATSFATNVTVEVRSPIVATPTEAQTIAEEGGDVELRAVDLGDAPGDVCVEIVEPPPQGRLVDGWGAEVGAGAALSTKLRPPFAAGAPVRYESDEDAFTAPNQMWNGSALAAPSIQIKYRAFACDAPQRASPVATQSLEVINVNDAPALLYPARAFAVYAGVAESDDEFPSTVLLEGLELTDADRDVDAVRVTVAARFPTSMLSMDAALLPLADFNSDRDCFGRGASGWRCEGDGLDDARFTFVATPSAANKLLKTLSYRSIATDVRDVVSVEVFDGVGGECLHEHTTASIRDGCFRRNASLTIYVASYALFEQHASARDRKDRRWAKKYGWPYSAFAGLVLLMCCCCAGCCRRRTSDDGAVVKKKRRKRAWCCSRRQRSSGDEELGSYSPAEDEKEEPPEPPRAEPSAPPRATVHEEPPLATVHEQPPPSTVLKPFATVLQPYAPTEDWQLPLAGGARVKVLQIHEDGWAEVRDASGTTGLVPACYLDLPPPAPGK